MAARLAREQPSAAPDDLEHEPDAPIYTDRITAIMQRPLGHLAVLGIARRSSAARQASNIITMTVVLWSLARWCF